MGEPLEPLPGFVVLGLGVLGLLLEPFPDATGPDQFGLESEELLCVVVGDDGIVVGHGVAPFISSASRRSHQSFAASAEPNRSGTITR